MNEVEIILQKINWNEYETAYGNANEDIPHYIDIGDSRGYTPKIRTSLLELFSDDRKIAMDASHQLWCGLCHQYAYVLSAALPSFDILMLALRTLDDQMKIEVLDILKGFAYCTSQNDVILNNWKGLLRNKLAQNIDYFKELGEHPIEDVSSFATDILDGLSEYI